MLRRVRGVALLLLLVLLAGTGFERGEAVAGGRTNNAWEMPQFRLPGLDGRVHRLDDWRGKVIVLNFWASWCPTCVYEIPEFNRYQAEYGNKGLQIIGMGVDEERKLRNAARSLDIDYPVLVAGLGPGNKLLRQWGNKLGVVPYTVVIARSGQISYIHRGTMDSETFEDYVLPLL